MWNPRIYSITQSLRKHKLVNRIDVTKSINLTVSELNIIAAVLTLTVKQKRFKILCQRQEIYSLMTTLESKTNKNYFELIHQMH